MNARNARVKEDSDSDGINYGQTDVVILDTTSLFKNKFRILRKNIELIQGQVGLIPRYST